MPHITKEKGDIGLTKIIADLTEQGFHCVLPLSDHLPFDLIVCDTNYKLYKVQIKYKTIEYHEHDQSGYIRLSLTTVYSTKKGNVVTHYNLTDFDYFAIYNPDTGKCFYISTAEIINAGNTTTVNFKMSSTDKNSRLIDNYLKFDKVAQ